MEASPQVQVRCHFQVVRMVWADRRRIRRGICRPQGSPPQRSPQKVQKVADQAKGSARDLGRWPPGERAPPACGTLTMRTWVKMEMKTRIRESGFTPEVLPSGPGTEGQTLGSSAGGALPHPSRDAGGTAMGVGWGRHCPPPAGPVGAQET